MICDKIEKLRRERLLAFRAGLHCRFNSSCAPQLVLRKAFSNLRSVIRCPPYRVLCLQGCRNGFTTYYHPTDEQETSECVRRFLKPTTTYALHSTQPSFGLSVIKAVIFTHLIGRKTLWMWLYIFIRLQKLGGKLRNECPLRCFASSEAIYPKFFHLPSKYVYVLSTS